MSTPATNRILAVLPPEERARLVPELHETQMALGDLVYESGGRLDYVCFPTSCIVSLIYTMADGAVAEMGLVGNDGIVGVALFMGGNTMPNRAVVQLAGSAVRMKSTKLQEEFHRGGCLQEVLLRYTQALITQISQTAVCNRLHSVEQRLSRWLLLCHDRVGSDDLMMTQEFISNMLGGRRQSVTVAAGRLQDAGLIQYSRGHIKLLDRKGLENCVCECYQGHCQVERKYAHRLKVADCHSVIFGPQKRASRPITPMRSFPSNAPILPQLDNAVQDNRDDCPLRSE